jgi:hypothetical protein
VRLFVCPACQNILYFENRTCGQCGHRLAFDPNSLTLLAVEPAGQGWKPVSGPSEPRLFCANEQFDSCNWLVDEKTEARYCRACRHNGTVPDLTDPGRLAAWREIEIAKHRLFYSLLRWRLPLVTRAEDPAHGLTFNFLADDPMAGHKIMTGHDNGRITIALSEADDAEREKRRQEMGEPYRTLLGHFRHEVGHYFWDVLVRDGGKLEASRALFGDDAIDYGEALKRHYAEGPPGDWQQRYVSSYATTHPWEDFAETWAHYIHIVDTLEMAGAFSLEVHPHADKTGRLAAEVSFDPYAAERFDTVIASWLPVTFALNSVNRAMGLRDLYPFILSPPVIEKLGFVHRLVQDRQRRS